MEENIFNRLVYLDHNILDQMTKGDPRGMKKIFESGELIAVYSNENLNEIKRSEGYESSFLEVLTNIKARYIVPNMDHKFRYIGTAQVHERDPIEAYNSYLNEVDEMPEYGYGMSGMLQKMYGGLVDQSFSEILAKGSNEIGEMLQIPDEDIDGLDIDDSEKIIVKNYLKMLPGILNQRFSDLGSMLDKNAVENSVKELERTTGIGPKVLKNISSPNKLNKIWDRAKEGLNGANITLEKFFGIDQSEWSSDPGRELSAVEKVNAIYQQLNYIGYYRDSKMKNSRRFRSSFSDMTHAGMATFCRFFICGDEDLAMKAAAAYEYLGLHTKIVYVKI